MTVTHYFHSEDCEMSRIDASFNCTCGAKPVQDEPTQRSQPLTIIVKLQKPIYPPTSEECLCYSEDGAVDGIFQFRHLPKPIQKRLARFPKLFAFYDTVKGKVLTIAPEQPW